MKHAILLFFITMNYHLLLYSAWLNTDFKYKDVALNNTTSKGAVIKKDSSIELVEISLDHLDILPVYNAIKKEIEQIYEKHYSIFSNDATIIEKSLPGIINLLTRYQTHFSSDNRLLLSLCEKNNFFGLFINVLIKKASDNLDLVTVDTLDSVTNPEEYQRIKELNTLPFFLKSYCMQSAYHKSNRPYTVDFYFSNDVPLKAVISRDNLLAINSPDKVRLISLDTMKKISTFVVKYTPHNLFFSEDSTLLAIYYKNKKDQSVIDIRRVDSLDTLVSCIKQPYCVSHSVIIATPDKIECVLFIPDANSKDITYCQRWNIKPNKKPECKRNYAIPFKRTADMQNRNYYCDINQNDKKVSVVKFCSQPLWLYCQALNNYMQGHTKEEYDVISQRIQSPHRYKELSSYEKEKVNNFLITKKAIYTSYLKKIPQEAVSKEFFHIVE